MNNTLLCIHICTLISQLFQLPTKLRMDGTTIIGVLIVLIVVFIFIIIIRDTQNEPRIQPHHYYYDNTQRQPHYINVNRGVESFGSRGSYIFHCKEEEGCPNEYEAAQIAHSEDGVTHLLTNEGKLYRSNSDPPYTHAEFILTRKTQAHNITKIWIKNSPCAGCSRVLIKFFQHCRKPIIYVGHIYQIDNQEDREGLKNLCQQGFKLEVWETLHTMKHGPYSCKTHNYLRDVKQEARDT